MKIIVEDYYKSDEKMVPRKDYSTLEKVALVSILVEEEDEFKNHQAGDIIKALGYVNNL